MARESTDELLVELSARRFSVGFSVFFFAFGIAAGFLLAFTGLGFLEDSAGVIAGVFLVALLSVALSGLVLFLLRRKLLEKIFGVAEAQMELLAGPLTGVAEGAAARDPERAMQSARRLIQVGLARYAWLATRRWIMTSLTALIAAMAALAGTALLFKQNALIAVQSELLAEQNEKLREQTVMLSQDVQLAEAARNAGLAVEVTAIAAMLGALADRVAAQQGPSGAPGAAALVPVLDPMRDLERGLILRITAASQGMRPYRFLDIGLSVAQPMDRLRVALESRRADLPQLWAHLAAQEGWQENGAESMLIDRPASPERGQLLRVLVGAGLRDLELLNHFGLDLSFAFAQGMNLIMVSMENANLAHADLSHAELRVVGLSGATLDNARLRHAGLRQVRAGAIAGEAAREPFTAPGVHYVTSMVGADFSQALIHESDFSGANAMAARFDGATLVAVDFTGASLGAASLRGALIVAPRLAGADLRSVDLDGAVLFGADPLAELTAVAAPGSFRADRYRAEPVAREAVLGAGRLWEAVDEGGLQALVGDAPAWRLVRISGFED